MLIDRFTYFTFSCFECTLNEIESLLQSKLINKGKYSLEKRKFQFDLYQTSPKKGGAHLPKVYFFQPILNQSICVMFSNYSDGWYTLANFIVDELKINAYAFRISSTEGLDSVNAFSVWKNGDLVRNVYAMKDPRWLFYEDGELQWFENSEYYKQKRINKRLNKNILISYCLKLNLEISEDLFWESNNAILVEAINSVSSITK